MGVRAQRRGRLLSLLASGVRVVGGACPSCMRSAVGLIGRAPSSFILERRPPSPWRLAGYAGQNLSKSTVKIWDFKSVCSLCLQRRKRTTNRCQLWPMIFTQKNLGEKRTDVCDLLKNASRHSQTLSLGF